MQARQGCGDRTGQVEPAPESDPLGSAFKHRKIRCHEVTKGAEASGWCSQLPNMCVRQRSKDSFFDYRSQLPDRPFKLVSASRNFRSWKAKRLTVSGRGRQPYRNRFVLRLQYQPPTCCVLGCYTLTRTSRLHISNVTNLLPNNLLQHRNKYRFPRVGSDSTAQMTFESTAVPIAAPQAAWWSGCKPPDLLCRCLGLQSRRSGCAT